MGDSPEEDLREEPTQVLPQVGPHLPAELFESLERAILGQVPHLNRREVLERAGVSVERADALWLSLGFSPPADDEEVLFIDDDVEALGTLTALVEVGVVNPRTELAISRSMGRSFARLAEWEVSELAGRMLEDLDVDIDPGALEAVAAQVLPAVERLQNYVWRRHLASAAGRMLLQVAASEQAAPVTVGFADIVGFTRRSRNMTIEELDAMVEAFEHTSTQMIADQQGRVIKTIGDEVLFEADDPVAAARIGLLLAGGHEEDYAFPELRVGMAYGPVLHRLGDVFGEVVNIASRLTSLARPGRVLLDRALADELRPLEEEFRVRRARTVPVKGYARLETWSLKHPKPQRETGERLARSREAIDIVTDRLTLPGSH